MIDINGIVQPRFHVPVPDKVRGLGGGWFSA